MKDNTLRITLIVCACAAIAISNQVFADQVPASKHMTSPLLTQPGTEEALALEEKKLEQAEEKTATVNNILRSDEKAKEVQMGPEYQKDWPEEEKVPER